MADKLTIDSNIPSVLPTASQGSEPQESPELVELRDEVQARTGSRLEDSVLKAILGHRKAEAEGQAELASSKANFEAEASVESLSTGDDGGDALRRAIGADSAKGLDQLTQREREQIRSLKSGAVLPPLSPGLEPISSDAAEALSLRVLESKLGDITVDGQTFDSPEALLEAYQSSLSTSSGAKSKGSAGGPVGLHAMQLSAGAPKSGGGASLAMKLGGSSAPKSKAALGALDSGKVAFADSSWNSLLWSFMARSINDDQSWRKMMKTLRQADGELKIGFKQLEQQMTELKQTNERQQQQVRLSQSGWSMNETMLQKKAEELVGANPTHSAEGSPTGAGDTEGNVDASKPLQYVDHQLAQFGKKVRGETGHGELAEGEVSIKLKGNTQPRRFLTPSELSRLSSKDQEAYLKLREERVLYGGLTGELAAMRLEAVERGIVADAEASPKDGTVEIQEEGMAKLTGKSRVIDPEYARMLEKAEHHIDLQMYGLSQDPRGYANLRNMRNGLMGRVRGLKAGLERAKSASEANPDDAKLKADVDGTARDLAIHLDAVVTLDEKMLSYRPGAKNEPFQNYIAAQKKSQGEKAGQVDELKAKKESLKVDGERPASGTPEGDEYDAVSNQLSEAQKAADYMEHLPALEDPEAVTIDHLGVGETVQERIDAFSPVASVGTNLHENEEDLYLDFRAVERTDSPMGAYRSLWAVQQFWSAPVQRSQGAAIKQAQSAAGQFGGSGKQAHGQLQRQLGKVRGMIDQLIQLTKV